MGQEASVPTDRGRRLEVIDAGFSRTGTLSYAYALEELLDGPVHHTASQLFNREDCKYNLGFLLVLGALIDISQRTVENGIRYIDTSVKEIAHSYSKRLKMPFQVLQVQRMSQPLISSQNSWNYIQMQNSSSSHALQRRGGRVSSQ